MWYHTIEITILQKGTVYMKKGFFLIQLIISVAVLSIICGLVISHRFFLQHLKVLSEIEKLHSICLYLNHKAIITKQKKMLAFNINDNSYSYENKKEFLPKNVIFGIKNKLNGPPSAPSKLLTKPITFPNNKISFTSQGILQPGSIYLIDKNKKYQYALSVPVSQISFIRKYKYNKKWEYLS